MVIRNILHCFRPKDCGQGYLCVPMAGGNVLRAHLCTCTSVEIDLVFKFSSRRTMFSILLPWSYQGKMGEYKLSTISKTAPSQDRRVGNGHELEMSLCDII